jgi:hypothetical protein
MPQSVIYVSSIELFLMLLTTWILQRPRYKKLKKGIRFKSMRLRFTQWLGFFFLAILFLWSVILGITLSVHGFAF